VKKIVEGDWVQVLGTGEKGVAERFLEGDKVFVRIPSPNDWPFPRWEMLDKADLKRTRSPSLKKPKPEVKFEEALL
jgi:hypothetical protein